MARGRQAREDGNEPQPQVEEQQPAVAMAPQTTINNLETLLQGLERIARRAVEVDQRQHHNVDPFFELYRSFSSLLPPHFDGTGDFLAAKNWLASINNKFQLVRVPEENKVELATQFLDSHARFWWQEARRRYNGDLPRLPWEWFEQQFEERYMDIMSRESLRQQFTSLKQGDTTVLEYNTKFENLMRYAPDITNDEFRLRQQYLCGLNPRVAQLIDIPGINRLPHLMLRASTVESYDARIGKEENPRNVKQKIDETNKSVQWKGEASRGRNEGGTQKTDWCRRCHKPHQESQCRVLDGLCYNCHKPGHIAKNCPEPTQSGYGQHTNTTQVVVTGQEAGKNRGGDWTGIHSHTYCYPRSTQAEVKDGTVGQAEDATNSMGGKLEL